MPNPIETEKPDKTEKVETKETPTQSAVDTVQIPPAVTEAIKKAKEEGKSASVMLEEPPAEHTGEIEKEKSEGEKPKETPQEKEPSEPAGEEKFYYEEIDPQLVDEAHKAGWSDDEIEKMASDNYDLFVRTFTPKPAPAKEIPPKKEAEEIIKPLSKINLDKDTIQKWTDAYGQEAVDSAIKPMAETLNAAIDELNTIRTDVGKVQGRFTEQDKNAENQKRVLKLQQANKVFDEESKNYSEIGQTENLPKTQSGEIIMSSTEFKTRSEIYGIAEMFEKEGYRWPDALRQAMVWYAGKVGEKRAEQRLIADINKDKRRWVARPDQKKVEREFATPDEAKKAIIAEAKKKAGYTSG